MQPTTLLTLSLASLTAGALGAALNGLEKRAAPTTRHFYTTDANGELAAGDNFKFFPGFVVGYGEQTQVPGTTPLYRCRNDANDLWLLTTDSNCEGAGDFHLEGPVFNIYTSQVPGSQPLDRYLNSAVDHMFVRRDVFGTDNCDFGAYTMEGTTGYVMTTQGSNSVPLYQFRKGTNDPSVDGCQFS